MCSYHTLEEISSFREMRRKWAMVGEASGHREILRNFTVKRSQEIWTWLKVLGFCLFSPKWEILGYCVLNNLFFFFFYKKEILVADEKGAVYPQEPSADFWSRQGDADSLLPASCLEDNCVSWNNAHEEWGHEDVWAHKTGWWQENRALGIKILDVFDHQ